MIVFQLNITNITAVKSIKEAFLYFDPKRSEARGQRSFEDLMEVLKAKTLDDIYIQLSTEVGSVKIVSCVYVSF